MSNNKNNNEISNFYLEEAESISKIGLYQIDIVNNRISNISSGLFKIFENDEIINFKILQNLWIKMILVYINYL